MRSDLEILSKLEILLAIELQSASSCDLENRYLSEHEPSYVTNESGDVTMLNIRGLGIDTFPKELFELKHLKFLNLGENEISSLPPLVTSLGLDFSLDEGPLWDSGFIYLDGNPLEFPPVEIIDKGREAVVAYFKSFRNSRPIELSQSSAIETEEFLNEAKIIFVGDGAVGKTSLVKRLLKEKFDPEEAQTHGINIRDWSVRHEGRDIVAHFWDFGGQEIMHATHQFFLSKRSVYILVLDGRKDEKTEYWLKAIESFGGDSPILIVLNKLDENPGFDVNRRFLKGKYQNIAGFYPISCVNRIGIDRFRRALKRTLGRIKLLQTIWARSWFEIKKDLETMGSPFISYRQYSELCKDKGVSDEVSQNTLVGFLADLGVVVHFSDFELREVYVLEPKWVTEGVYKIINSEELAQNKGFLDLGRLPKILDRDNYPFDKQRYLVDLMKKFELCYQINSEHVLIPDLLEVQEPSIAWDDSTPLRFRLDYDFLPRSIIPRFIVKLHKDIYQDLVWRTGVVLRSPTFDSTAIIKCDHEDKKIHIQVIGPRRRDYFAAILYFLRDINSSFKKLRIDERVPLPDNPTATIGYEHLLKHEQSGLSECFPEGGNGFYKVHELLGLVQDENATEERIREVQREILDKIDAPTALKALDIFEFKPNFAGIGINLNALIDWIKRIVNKRTA